MNDTMQYWRNKWNQAADHSKATDTSKLFRAPEENKEETSNGISIFATTNIILPKIKTSCINKKKELILGTYETKQKKIYSEL